VTRITLFAIVVCICGSVALADDLRMPEWPRYGDGTTYARWEFEIDPDAPVDWDNPYATEPPMVQPGPGAEYDPGEGAWVLGYGAAIEILIANRPDPLAQKMIQIQVTFKPLGDPLSGPEYPMIQAGSEAEVQQGIWHDAWQEPPSTVLGDGWIHEVSRIDLFPNPESEIVKIGGGILVRELVIDTICVPEPATLSLLALGAVALIRRR